MNRQGVREHFVYWLFDSDDECLYVGMTRQPEERWRQHRRERPEMAAAVATKRMAGPFNEKTARRLERQQQDDLSPLYDGRVRPRGHVVALRPDAAQTLLAGFNAATSTELADHIGLHPSQISRVLAGKNLPSNGFISSVIDRCGLDAFDRVFQIAPDEARK